MKKILSLLLPVIALVVGVVGGEFLRPSDPAEAAASDGTPHDPPAIEEPQDDIDGAELASSFFTFPSQFFVPLMRQGDMGAVMILTLSIETDADQLEAMEKQEHRLRDAMLRELLIQANTGGFDGNFTSEASMRVTRDGLLKAARSATPLTVRHVLIEDIARQDR